MDQGVGSRNAMRLVTPSERRTQEDRNDDKVTALARRLKGLDGKPAPTGVARSKVIARFESLNLERFPEVDDLLQLEWAIPSHVRRSKKSDTTPTSTIIGLANADRSDPYIIDEIVLGTMQSSLGRFRREAARTGQRPEWRCRGDKRVLEDHPRLDLRVLADREYVQAEKIDAGRLLWSTPGHKTGLISFLVDTTDPQLPFIVLRFTDRIGEPEQVIRLRRPDQGKRKRWYFLCPVTGEPKEVLAYRDSRFASPEAQALVYRSRVERSRAARAD